MSVCPSVKKLFEAEIQTKNRKVKSTSYPHDKLQSCNDLRSVKPILSRYNFNDRVNLRLVFVIKRINKKIEKLECPSDCIIDFLIIF